MVVEHVVWVPARQIKASPSPLASQCMQAPISGVHSGTARGRAGGAGAWAHYRGRGCAIARGAARAAAREGQVVPATVARVPPVRRVVGEQLEVTVFQQEPTANPSGT